MGITKAELSTGPGCAFPILHIRFDSDAARDAFRRDRVNGVLGMVVASEPECPGELRVGFANATVEGRCVRFEINGEVNLPRIEPIVRAAGLVARSHVCAGVSHHFVAHSRQALDDGIQAFSDAQPPRQAPTPRPAAAPGAPARVFTPPKPVQASPAAVPEPNATAAIVFAGNERRIHTPVKPPIPHFAHLVRTPPPAVAPAGPAFMPRSRRNTFAASAARKLEFGPSRTAAADPPVVAPVNTPRVVLPGAVCAGAGPHAHPHAPARTSPRAMAL